MPPLNEFHQAIGDPVPAWTPRPPPPHASLQGRFCRLEPIDPKRHARQLFDANNTAPDGRAWTYLATEAFTGFAAFYAWLENMAGSRDPLFFAVLDNATQRAVGYLALLRIDPANGVMEVGHINYSPLLQRTPAGTEAQYLLMKLALGTLGYRRFEWKCDSLNAPSRQAALRFGFSFEGIFRQAVVVKGRSRDTAWFSILDREWLAIKAALETWLSPENFTADGRQCMALADIRQRLNDKVPDWLCTERQQSK